MTPSLTLLVLDTPNRIPARPKGVVSDITTARAEGGVVRGRASRGRRPVVTAATLTAVSTIIPATVASKRQTDGTASTVVDIGLITCADTWSVVYDGVESTPFGRSGRGTS